MTAEVVQGLQILLAVITHAEVKLRIYLVEMIALDFVQSFPSARDPQQMLGALRRG